MNTEQSKRFNELRLRFKALWPDVKTEQGQKSAVTQGAIALLYLAASYTLNIVLAVFTNRDVLGAFTDGYQRVGMIVFYACAVVLALVLSWCVWKKRSIIAAWIGFVVVGLEAAAKLLAGPQGAFLAIVVFVFVLNGVRGAHAGKRALTAPPVDA